MDKKKIFLKYRGLVCFGLWLHNFLSIKKRINGKNNRIIGLNGVWAKKIKITVYGNNNVIEFGEMSQIINSSFCIMGNNNTIILGKRNYIAECSFDIEDDNGKICTGEHTYIHNRSEISAIESTEIVIGNDCLFSSDVIIRSGDSHRIENVETGKRINPSLDICIGNHVWIGKRAMVLKGVHIADGCVIGAGAIMTRGSIETPDSIFSGNPAQCTKKGINWCHIRNDI